MNQRDLVKALAKKINLPSKKTRKLVESFGDVITSALTDGQKVTYSNFGTFYLVNYPSKVINHPVFGKKKRTVMLDTKVVKWMPSDSLKDLVNHHLEAENITTFGAAKKIAAAKKEAGIADYKAQTISEDEQRALIEAHKTAKKPTIDEEITEVPIRIIKKDWTDLPVTQRETKERLVTPFTRISRDQVEFIDLSQTPIPKAILYLIPKEVASRTKVVPIDLKNEILILGMTDPTDHESLDVIKKLVRKRISPRLISERDLSEILSRYDLLKTDNKIVVEPPESQPINLSKSTPATRVINLILKRAIREQASAIYFDPVDSNIHVRFKINDELVDKTRLDRSLHQKILAHFKKMAGKPQERNGIVRQLFSVKIDGVKEEFELISITAIDGEKITLKIKDRLKDLKKITELGFGGRDYQAIIDSAMKPGINLVAGQSSKSRSELFYSFADFYHDKKLHVVTLERNPALALPGISQIDINNISNFNFPTTLSALSDFDCDVLMLDEIPNREILDQVSLLFADKIVVISAEAIDSIELISRLQGLNVTNSLVKKINFVVAAKEVPGLCPYCHKLIKIDSKTARQIRDILSVLPASERSALRRLGSHFYHNSKCSKCNNSGYIGKVSLLELIILDEKIRDLIIDGADANKIKKEGQKSHYTNFVLDGIIRALIGEVALSDILPED